MRVGKGGTHVRRTGLRVDDTADGLDFALQGIDAAVGELERYGRKFRQEIVGTVLGGQFQNLTLGHREVDIHLGVVRHGGERRSRRRRYQATYPEGNLAYHTVERAGYAGIRVVVAGIHQLSLGLSQLSLGRRVGVLGHLQIVLADDVAALQLALVFGRQSGSLGIGASHLDIGLPSGQPCKAPYRLRRAPGLYARPNPRLPAVR